MSSNQYDDFMTHGSLFSGIGGFDLAAEWAGWTNAFNCEIDPFCRKVLKYHFPYAEQYEDIRTSDFGKWRDRIDVLSGGFPCQPFSAAGKRRGTDDDRYLWPAMLDVIRSVRPRWVVGENVFGLINWSDGLVFDTVCSDLEKAGYEVGAFVIPACAANAPHRRDRIWFVAHCADARAEDKRRGSEPADTDGDAAHADGDRRRIGEDEQEPLAEREGEAYAGVDGEERIAADAERVGRNAFPLYHGGLEAAQQAEGRAVEYGGANSAYYGWRNFPTESPIRSGDDGLSERLDGITFPAWRAASIKAYGNAIVLQVVYRIFNTINEYEKVY